MHGQNMIENQPVLVPNPTNQFDPLNQGKQQKQKKNKIKNFKFSK